MQILWQHTCGAYSRYHSFLYLFDASLSGSVADTLNNPFFNAARKKMFGPSTEVSKHLDGQLSMFETAQKLAEELEKEQKKVTVPAHTRTARQPGVRAEMLSGLLQEIEEYIIPETDTCMKCGSGLKIIGKRIVRTEVEFVPAKLKVKQIVQQVAKCIK